MLFPSLSRELLNWPQLSRPIEQSVATFEREAAKTGLNVDVYETDSEYVVQVDLPGFRDSDLQIEVEDDVLIIFAKKPDTPSESTTPDNKQPLWHLRERSSLKEATRRFALPNGIDVTKISSTFQDGLLDVTIPKLEEKKSSTRKIEVLTKKIN